MNNILPLDNLIKEFIRLYKLIGIGWTIEFYIRKSLPYKLSTLWIKFVWIYRSILIKFMY